MLGKQEKVELEISESKLVCQKLGLMGGQNNETTGHSAHRSHFWVQKRNFGEKILSTGARSTTMAATLISWEPGPLSSGS